MLSYLGVFWTHIQMENKDIAASKLLKEGYLKQNDNTGFYIPRRYIMAVLLFNVCMLMNCQRSCLSVAIVAMSSDTRFYDAGKWKMQVHSHFCWRNTNISRKTDHEHIKPMKQPNVLFLRKSAIALSKLLMKTEHNMFHFALPAIAK